MAVGRRAIELGRPDHSIGGHSRERENLVTTSKHHIASTRTALIAAALALLPAAAASAQAINSFNATERVFNDFTTTTLTTTDPGTNPGTYIFSETGFTNDGVGGNFANRHDVRASSDGGATNRFFSTGESFSISTTLTLDVSSTGTVKEAGFRIIGNPTGEALFIVKTNGEIAAFGGGAPFKSFAGAGAANGYVEGTPILMGMNYVAGTGGNKGTLEYYINRGSGIETTGPLLYNNLEGGPVNFQLGVYTQTPPDLNFTPGETITTTFANLQATLVPEPATLAALAMAGTVVGRRRRA